MLDICLQGENGDGEHFDLLFPLSDCKECAVSTEPVYGYHMKWWRSMPEGLHASCFSMSGERMF